MWSEQERPAKEQQRDQFFAGVQQSRCYLTLPGIDCGDLRTGCKLGALNPNTTKVVAVERELGIYQAIHRWIDKNWSASSQIHHKEMADLQEFWPVDLAFLDYLGNLTCKDCTWIKQTLCNKLLPGTTLGITVCNAYRGSVLVPAVRELLVNNHSRYFFQASKELRDNGEFPDTLVEFLNIYHVLLKCCLFPGYFFNLEINHYGEEESACIMCLLKMTNLRKEAYKQTTEESKINEALTSLVQQGIRRERASPVAAYERIEEMARSRISGNEVIEAMQNANSSGTKAAATRLLKAYCQQRVKEDGCDPVMVEAGIKARLTRIENGN
jgi:hypothetical protein